MAEAKTNTAETVEISAEELAALRAEAARYKDEAERYRPFRDVSNMMFESPQQVIDYFGPKAMRDLATSELSDINKVRLRQGLDRVTYTEEEWEEAIQAKAAEMAQDRFKHVPTEGGARRTLKMVNPNSGTVVQIPVEDQINNQAGSMGDGVNRYKDKGFKMAVDSEGRILCPTENCWAPAHGESGAYTYGGYCSERHRLMVEPRKVGGVDNVITAGALRV